MPIRMMKKNGDVPAHLQGFWPGGGVCLAASSSSTGGGALPSCCSRMSVICVLQKARSSELSMPAFRDSVLGRDDNLETW